jgi:flagellar export protein FliJ
MSGRFTFRLQRVLDLREKAERARAVALAGAEARATEAQNARAAIAAARTAGRESIATTTTAGATAGALQQMTFVLAAMDAQLDIADAGIITAESLVRRAQDELRTAFQARHALQTLREKREHAHRTATLGADRALMDEIALTRFHVADTSPTDPERSTNG